MKICAYCGGQGRCTKEHIFPNWLLRLTNYPVAYSAKAGRRIGKNQTIKDVCADCNNGPLGALDGYARGLYDQYLARWVEDGERVEFEFDHGRLLRWLLKVSFNSSRATGQDVEVLRQYRETLCSPFDCSPIFMAAFVGTIRPVEVSDLVTRKSRTIYPSGARIGLLSSIVDPDRRYAMRAMQINAYRFSILITPHGAVDPAEIERILPVMYGVPLTPDGKVLLPPPRLDALHSMKGVEQWPD